MTVKRLKKLWTDFLWRRGWKRIHLWRCDICGCGEYSDIYPQVCPMCGNWHSFLQEEENDEGYV